MENGICHPARRKTACGAAPFQVAKRNALRRRRPTHILASRRIFPLAAPASPFIRDVIVIGNRLGVHETFSNSYG